MALLIAGAAGAIAGLLLSKGHTGSEDVNKVSIQVTDAVMATVDESVNLNISYTIENIHISVVGSGSINVDIDQETIAKTVLNLNAAINTLTNLTIKLSQKASLKDRSFLGINFSKQVSGDVQKETYKDTITQTLKQTTNYNVTQLINNVNININQSKGTGIISSPKPINLAIKQGSDLNIRNEVKTAVKNSLSNQVTTNQKSKSDTSSDPITNFFDGLKKLFGSMYLFWILIAAGVVIFFLMRRKGSSEPLVIRRRRPEYSYANPRYRYTQPMPTFAQPPPTTQYAQPPPTAAQYTQPQAAGQYVPPLGYRYVPRQPTTQQVPVQVPPGYILQPAT